MGLFSGVINYVFIQIKRTYLPSYSINFSKGYNFTMRKISLFLITLFFIFTTEATAARYALVMTKKAIVYADKELKSPIGYISAGRKIMIGEKERKRGSILPIVVAGRIAWIRVVDISIDRESYKTKSQKTSARFAITEEEFRDKNEKAEDTLFNNNHFFLSYGVGSGSMNFTVSGELSGQQVSAERSADQTPTSYTVEFVHRSPFRRTLWSVSLGYHSYTSEDESWSTFLGGANYYWSAIKSRLFTIDVYVGGVLTGDFKITGPGFSESGTAFGYKLGGQLKLFPFSSMGIIAGAYRQDLFINDLAFQVESLSQKIDSMTGINFYAGITWKL